MPSIQKIDQNMFYDYIKPINTSVLDKNFLLIKNLSDPLQEMRVSKNTKEIYLLDPNSYLDGLRSSLSKIWHFIMKCYEKGVFAPKENSYEDLLTVLVLSIQRGLDLAALELTDSHELLKEDQDRFFIKDFPKTWHQLKNSIDYLQIYFQTHLETDHPELFKESQELIAEANRDLKFLYLTKIYLNVSREALSPEVIRDCFNRAAYGCVGGKTLPQNTPTTTESVSTINPALEEIALPSETIIKLPAPVSQRDLLVDLKKQLQSPKDFEKTILQLKDKNFLRQHFIETQLGYLKQITSLEENLDNDTFYAKPLSENLKGKIVDLFYYYQTHSALITNEHAKKQMSDLIGKC